MQGDRQAGEAAANDGDIKFHKVRMIRMLAHDMKRHLTTWQWPAVGL
jgi:hypothetical protein